MTKRVLLSGGSGFIAAHVLDILLSRGYSVVTTVRSQEKADKIAKAHPTYGKDKLDFAIVEDIAQEGAFDEAVKSDPPFEAVIHTASPFHFNVTDVKKQLLDPAIIGTTGILRSIKKSAPTVKRVVITSSFAAILDAYDIPKVGHTYSEADWDPITEKDALQDPRWGYRASKTFAERAAWDFVEKEKPNFDLATINPPLVIGPIVHYLNSLSSLNTSNETVRDMIQGKFKDGLPPTANPMWIDVRDTAEAHVNALEKPNFGGKRCYFTAGYTSHREIADIIIKNFPEYAGVIPKTGGEMVEFAGYNNTRAKELLGHEFISIEKSIVDLVKSLKEVGA
ncbi:uncharacterized protein PV09_01226 [Verruconis gallopava]|uniref:NAD-dependent epimerase/dehydratase domain-containing protein n=1 Tax=Verruconis gallopava TaxID=253628 RepID=A0A0D1Z5R1_9PEZI|nr:uncharacterized protein PV09_01226 [Verruconis gallopava]KIW08307.1 hypothetical protein PV09_01226 [Verruconis gallopava]